MPRVAHIEPTTEFRERLAERRGELEQTILTRVYAIADPTEVPEAQYVEGLRRAVSAALDYGLETVRLGRAPEVPSALLVQSRLAARCGVSLETVLRRCCGGNTLLADVVIEEAERAGLPRSDLKRLHRAQASSFDRLLAVVSEEYGLAAETRPETLDQRRAELVERLLAGEVLDTAELSYNFDAWHLGLIATGPSSADAVRSLAAELDRALLVVERSEDSVWAWLGGRHPFDPELLARLPLGNCPTTVRFALGEPAHGLAGWRLTHRQAVATFPIAFRGRRPVARYSEAPLLASSLQDDLLATSLRQLYLDPLNEERDGGIAARDTLRAYFAASGNVSSAAAALGVNRRTVSSRIAAIEERLNQPVDAVSAEIETALRLEEIEQN